MKRLPFQPAFTAQAACLAPFSFRTGIAASLPNTGIDHPARAA